MKQSSIKILIQCWNFLFHETEKYIQKIVKQKLSQKNTHRKLHFKMLISIVLNYNRRVFMELGQQLIGMKIKTKIYEKNC